MDESTTIDSFVAKLEKAVRDAAERSWEYNRGHQTPDEWFVYEATLIAEIYHGLRNEGIAFDKLDVERPVAGYYLDLAYVDKSRALLAAIQVIPYRNSLTEGKMDDIGAFEIPTLASTPRILILLQLSHRRKMRPKTTESLLNEVRSRIPGIIILDIQPQSNHGQ